MGRIQDALNICPELVLVHVPTISNSSTLPQYHDAPTYDSHKVSLIPYRDASRKIMEIMGRFPAVLQRASIDEAYLDVTEYVNAEIHELIMQDKLPRQNGIPIVEWNNCGIVIGVTDASRNVGNENNKSELSSSGPAEAITYGWSDLKLKIGADLCTKIRNAVYDELKYTCSAGVSHNKTLSKLCSARNKPNMQTVLCDRFVLDFMKNTPVKDIRNLGSKLGTEIIEKLDVVNAGQVWDIPKNILQSHFGDSEGEWIYEICRGNCSEPVEKTKLPKSLGANKSLRPAATNMTDISKWILILSHEIYSRLQEDFELNSRWPKTISVSYKPQHSPVISKSLPMTTRFKTDSAEIIASLCMQMINPKNLLPCYSLGINTSSFECEDTTISIAKYFTSCNLPDPDSLEDIEYRITCEICGCLIPPDDASLFEHEDFHVAMQLHKESREELQKKPAKKMKQETCATLKCGILKFFKPL